MSGGEAAVTQERNTWKGVEFIWSDRRSAFRSVINLASKPYRLYYREAASGDGTEAWIEWEGGYTRTCVMGDAHLALEGAVIALEDHLQEAMNNLQKYLP